MSLFAAPPHGWRGEDAYGSGAFLAPRGGRLHWGADAVCIPHEEWRSPVSGIILRRRKPYPDDLQWSGVLIRASWGGLVTLFYLEPFPDLLGVEVSQGQVIGLAQNITLRYGPGMTPHLHCEVRLPRGWSLPLTWIQGVDHEWRYDGSYPGSYADPRKLCLA